MQNRRKVVMYLKATGHKEGGRTIFKPEYDDSRITEIAAYEIINGKLGNNFFHSFINTEGQAIDEKAQKALGVRRLNEINQAPFFKDIAEKLMEFIDPDHDGNTDLIVHNATYVQRHFDFAMNGAGLIWPPVENTDTDTITLSDDATVEYSSGELLIDESTSDFSSDEVSRESSSQESLSDKEPAARAEWTTICAHCNFIDVTALARKVGSVAANESGFNALCNRYNVSVSNRDCYSAKEDGKLLANLYIEVNKALTQKTKKHSLFGDVAKAATIEADRNDEQSPSLGRST